MMKLLFVCTANTCRSPMAEAIAPVLCREKGIEVECASAGIFASVGDGISRNAAEALKNLYGITGFFHRSQPTTRELMEKYDLVICMTGAHAKMLESFFGKNEKIIAMPRDISDPYGGYVEIYEAIAREIYNGLSELIDKKVIC